LDRMDWNEVRPVLAATYRLLDESDSTTAEQIAQDLGRPLDDARLKRALGLLYDAGYIDGPTIDALPYPVHIEFTEKGLRETAGWPKDGGGGDQIEALIRVLDEYIESDETPEEEKGRLRRAREAFVGVGRDVAVRVLTEYVSRQARQV
jgi:hypothetical protein